MLGENSFDVRRSTLVRACMRGFMRYLSLCGTCMRSSAWRGARSGLAQGSKRNGERGGGGSRVARRKSHEGRM